MIPQDANETLREPETGWSSGGTTGGLKLDPICGADDANKPLYRVLQVSALRAK